MGITVDGVWGPKTEAAFCAAIGSSAVGGDTVTTSLTTAFNHLKAGAAFQLQRYLNKTHANWALLSTGGVVNVVTLPLLDVDGKPWKATRFAFINYVGYCWGTRTRIHLEPAATGYDIFLDYSTGYTYLSMKALQTWINAANARKVMSYQGSSGHVPADG